MEFAPSTVPCAGWLLCIWWRSEKTVAGLFGHTPYFEALHHARSGNTESVRDLKALSCGRSAAEATAAAGPARAKSAAAAAEGKDEEELSEWQQRPTVLVLTGAKVLVQS